MARAKILIVDDEKPTRDVMARLLSGKYECLTAPDAEQAVAALEANPDVALLVTDYKMPGDNGIELVKKAKKLRPGIACILVTAFGEIDLAVAAMKDGADDFLTKPITDFDQLELRIAQALKTKNLERRVEELEGRLGEKTGLDAFTGNSDAMRRVYTLISKVAPTDATVLIEGPSGSGKELAAHAIHRLSRRSDGPFVAVECSAFSEELLKSELFGYEPGTFTGGLKEGKKGCFESAAGGTIFLDEIGEIDSATQIALLRTLESKSVRRIGGVAEIPVDFRLVAATNRNLAHLVAEGKFREDLFYRLNVIDIHLPALKDRPGDIALLSARFVREFSAANGGGVTGIDAEAMKALEDYGWPGNVRQLRNVIEKMVVLSGGGRLGIGDVPVEIVQASRHDAPAAAATQAPAAGSPAPAPTESLADAEKAKILSVLEECRGNKSKAAVRLGISRRTLHRKINEWGMR
ncbi:MAG: sigma-54-dependent Fis family transcriptional regulator [Kiritimatiellae bacterium]|nr:sigma-54-dependent Fis family transcriptional regulator [Kiritimatiellia bacterium]